MQYFIMFLLFISSVLLILLVLVQRGKGGGLAGAFGGMGGQSAFGTKAGDLFTRITIGVATVWILLCLGSVKYFADAQNKLDATLGGKSELKEGMTAPPGTEAPKPVSEEGTDAPGKDAPAKTPVSEKPATDPPAPAATEEATETTEKAAEEDSKDDGE